MASSSNYTDKTCDYIDIINYFCSSTEISEYFYSHMNSIFGYENENLKIPIKVLYNVKTKVQPFSIKPLGNVGYIKQFTGHNFNIGNSKK